ncbi:ferredoxin [Salinibacter ruber]|uniref:Ferredoxin n=1 Tax=Salinibacter ruber TaxID=146919 RepID=A0A9X3A016_9BACT|nr:ferredoxin [Salinibacter ruber]MCS3616630.1 ferredoxin [Salinibacter ruber]MCS4037753.1 ferredoxin [Salinibacter ruber]
MTRDVAGLTVEIDRTLCIGSGSCVGLADEIFEIYEQNLVRFQEDPPDIDPERLKEACAVCPVDALRVYDDDEQMVP